MVTGELGEAVMAKVDDMSPDVGAPVVREVNSEVVDCEEDVEEVGTWDVVLDVERRLVLDAGK
jgi:hypothetical protein